MTFSSRLDRARGTFFWRAARLAALAFAPYALATGCATGQAASPEEGAGGSGGSATASSSSSGQASSSSSSTSSSSSSSSSSTSSSSGAGGAGTGGAGTGGGTGGAGGSADAGVDAFVPPVGTADYPAETEQNNLKQTANPLAMGTKGFTGSIWPAGDVDMYRLDVAIAGSSLTVSTSDGMGGCPAGCATYVRVLDQSSLLASDTNGGPAECSLVDPQSNSSLASLALGTYYVQVESAVIGALPFYVVDIHLTPPSCGDKVVQFQAGEQCDDGNSMAGDGCSPTCTLEGDYVNETEPNNTQATANSATGHAGAVGQIDPAGDLDYFSFDVTVAGSSLIAAVDDGFGACPGFDSVITVFDPGNAQIATNDTGIVPPCSSLSPATDAGVTNLPIGKYTILVKHYYSSSTQPLYVLHLKVAAPGCGDGIVQAGEQCDDGNVVSGDGCSATCQLEGNFIPETEANDTQALANPLGMADGFFASITPVGDLDYFSFDVAVAGSSVQIVVDDGAGKCPGFDSKLFLYNPAAVQIATDDDGGVSPCSAITPALYPAAANLAVGTYKIRVQQTANAATQAAYVVHIKVSTPGCGDAILQMGEQCDDGNVMPGDGCSATCQAESPWEIEPNDALATATPLWPATSKWRGSIAPVGDHDYFAFTLAAVGSVTLETHSVGAPATCGFDTVIYLLDSNGAELVKDDDGGVDSCSKIDPLAYAGAKNLPAGQYYAWVQRYNDSQPISKYELTLTIQ